VVEIAVAVKLRRDNDQRLVFASARWWATPTPRLPPVLTAMGRTLQLPHASIGRSISPASNQLSVIAEPHSQLSPSSHRRPRCSCLPFSFLLSSLFSGSLWSPAGRWSKSLVSQVAVFVSNSIDSIPTIFSLHRCYPRVFVFIPHKAQKLADFELSQTVHVRS
jgi:hypothetical protein